MLTKLLDRKRDASRNRPFAARHAAAAAPYMDFVERHGTSQAPDQPSCFIVLPERLSREEWEARYVPKDDPPGDPNAID
ncbi:MAG: hypothetical protein AB7S74_14525 [Hyphomicrobium sp.]